MKTTMSKNFKSILAVLIISTFVFFYSSNKVYAGYGDSSIGVAFYGGYPHNLGGVFNFRFDGVPIMYGLNISDLDLDDYFLRVNFMADWWVLNGRIVGPFHYYLGPGFSFLFDIKSDRRNFDFELNFRLPIGLALVFGPFEIYGEVAPGVKILEVPAKGSAQFFEGDDIFVLSGQFGLRIWF